MIRGNLTYNRYRVRRNTTEPGFSFEARNDQVSQTLLIPGLDRLNPNKLFAQGQPGGWADPYDLTRMWVDDAGTTPMTIANLGTGIGRVVTKGNAITLVQANEADRPVWGRHPVSGIRNLISVSSETFAWAAGTGVTYGSYVSGPFAGMQGREIFGMTNATGDSVTTNVRALDTTLNTITSVIGQTYTRSLYIRRITPGSHLASLRIHQGVPSVIVNYTITENWQRISVTSGPATASATIRSILGGGGEADGVIVAGDMIEVSAAPTTYQRVTNRFDITEVGSPSLYYFSGNGVNQGWLSAANLNLSGVNVLTVWAAVRTNQGSTRAAIYSHNTDSANFSQLEAPGFNANTYEFIVRTGLSTAIADVAYTAPTTDTLVGVHNRDARQLWRNGVLVDTGTGDSGANNLPNAPLDILFRGSGPDRFFNGNLYSYIIAGDNYDTRTIQRFSDWLLKPRRLITA